VGGRGTEELVQITGHIVLVIVRFVKYFQPSRLHHQRADAEGSCMNSIFFPRVFIYQRLSRRLSNAWHTRNAPVATTDKQKAEPS
jgi:hypothetical protein